VVDEKGRFKKGEIPFNRGKTLEEVCGSKEKADDVRDRMSKAAHDPDRQKLLASYNADPEFLKKREDSRRHHETTVDEIAKIMRNRGDRIYILSGWIKDALPDLLVFKNGKLYAIEIEAVKKWKPSMETMKKRKIAEHTKHNFFDEILLVPISETPNIEDIVEYIDSVE
jgi:hypothetical protein